MISSQDSVLVVVDMQKGFLNENSCHIVPNVVSLIHECKDREIPVVFTKFFNTEGSPFERLIDWRKHYCSPETDIADELENYGCIEISKHFYSSFTERMIELVSANNWRNIILCGVATESCVAKTAVDAFESGLTPIVVADACASDAGEEAHQAGLLVLRRFIGERQIFSTAQLISHLDSKAR